jgi:hypothetical protein
MQTSRLTVLYDSLVVTGGTVGGASSFAGTVAAPTSAYVDHAGPGILFYGLECVSASNAGAGLPYIRYTSRDDPLQAMTASGGLCDFKAVSASASGMIALNLASGSTISHFVSCTAAIGATNATRVRYWLAYLGGSRSMGQLAG